MDPLSKRRVWTMIEQLKADRVMLLTTHSMEEADALGVNHFGTLGDIKESGEKKKDIQKKKRIYNKRKRKKS